MNNNFYCSLPDFVSKNILSSKEIQKYIIFIFVSRDMIVFFYKNNIYELYVSIASIFRWRIKYDFFYPPSKDGGNEYLYGGNEYLYRGNEYLYGGNGNINNYMKLVCLFISNFTFSHLKPL